MKRSLLLVLFTYLNLMLVAQDYKVISMEHLPLDMSAREEIKTDERGRQCALFRIATQNITPMQKEGFYFSSDYASYVVEKVLKNGEIWIWVSPGIKTLKIMHNTMGQWELQTTHYFSNVESLHTYKILIQGTAQPSQVIIQQPGSQVNSDEQCLQFNITPVDAQLFVDDTLWPLEDGIAKKIVKLGKHRYRVEAKDYHSDEGEVLVDDPAFTKMIRVDLDPAFGFLKIDDADVNLSEAIFYIDDDTTANRCAISPIVQLSSGQHKLRLTHPHYRTYTRAVTIGDQKTAILRPYPKTTFITLDFAHSAAPQNSFGFTIGSVTSVGWFLTAASDFNFEALNLHVNRYGTEDGMLWDYQGGYYYYPDYTGETASTRLSIMAGMLFRIMNPVYMKVGAGYGARVKAWYIAQGNLVTLSPESYRTIGSGNASMGFDTTVGLLVNLKYLSVGLDAVVGLYNYQGLKQITEFKIGIGYNWKKLK